MSGVIKNWSIIALCLHLIAAIWFAASPTRLGQWDAQRSIAYDSIWSEYIVDCDCTLTVE
jgi:cbb3-type cytochrome oxidase subunit 3